MREVARRTHYCGMITEALFGKTVRACGWVRRVRNLGGIIFIDLRDREGIVQIVIHPEKKPDLFTLAERIRSEFVLQIEGVVQFRPEGMQNEQMTTGKIEIHVTRLEILNESEPLPFPIDQYQTVNEELRLQYRYLDLRRPEMVESMKMASRLAQEIRNYLIDEGFLEIETPMLTKATPEGARDYLVPSRVHPGKFYALPQSPQLFKQILMMSGMDRYFQIVRCFRDEDLRADRQPEFTQLDLETSFLNEAEIREILAGMFQVIFRKLINVDLPAFQSMTYAEAMRRFGSDKPDLRIPLELIDIMDIVEHTEFKAFTEAAKYPPYRISALCVQSASLSRKKIDEYNEFVTKFGAKGLFTIKVIDREQKNIQSSLAKFLTADVITAILECTQAKTGDIIFICADSYKIVSDALSALRLRLGHDLDLIRAKWAPLWVTEFPLFENVGGVWTSAHHPFTAPKTTDISELKKDPGKILSRAWDCVMNGSELASGSIRINNIEMQKEVFRILGIGDEEAKEKFGFLLEAMKYGCPPHGGMAFGFGRIVMLLTGAESLREVVAFPKTTTATCPLTQAPSSVSKEQLNELHIRTLQAENK